MDLRSVIIKEWENENGYREAEVTTKDGEALGGITRIDYSIDSETRAGKASLELMNPEFFANAEAEYKMYDPNVKLYKTVSYVVFKDGTQLILGE